MFKAWIRVLSLLLGLCYFSFGLATTHRPQQFLDSIQGTKNEGEAIVEKFCASCHAVKPMIELGAPKIQQASDWQARVRQGLQRLLQHTEEGIGAMPARGGCFECTDQQLHLAMLAMIPYFMQKDLK